MATPHGSGPVGTVHVPAPHRVACQPHANAASKAHRVPSGQSESWEQEPTALPASPSASGLVASADDDPESGCAGGFEPASGEGGLNNPPDATSPPQCSAGMVSPKTRRSLRIMQRAWCLELESIKECAMTHSAAVSTPETLILGAGPAGLAMGACLRRAGASFEILERGEAIGNSWRNHYERLHLHTTKRHSALPGLPFPADYPTFPSRQQVVDYLDAYARRFSLAPRLGENVTAVRRSGGGYEVESNGRLLRATNVVMATGYNRTPLRPSWPGLGDYAGVVLHSRDYRNGETFRGKRVLVIGMGNTGGEIGLDLLEHGASPSISVRSPIIALPRDFLGRPTQITAIATRGLPRKVRDFLGTCVSRLVFGDLSGYGFGRPAYGPMTSIEVHRRIPLLDVGMVARVKDGSMPLRPDVTRFTPTGVVFADGREADFAAVVMATGYRTGLGELLGIPGLLDESGYPLKDHDRERAPGLHFIGFANVATGLLREIGLQARTIARELRASRA